MPVLSLDDGIIKQNNGIFLEGYSDVIRDGQYRLQTSQFKNIADFKFTSDANTQYWEDFNLAGTGNTVYDYDVGKATITANAASIRYIQTEYYAHIIPPYSYRFWFGCRLPAFTDGAARIGYWDGANGIYLQLSGITGADIIIENEDTATTITIDRSVWEDPLDGTGESGITLDSTLLQHYFLEYSWAGGFARFGALIDGIPRYAHTIYFGNNPTFTEAVIGNPSLPLRYEVEGNSGDQSLELYFATIQADIGEKSLGISRSVSRGHTRNNKLSVDKNNFNTDEFFSIVAIRLNPIEAVNKRAIVYPTRISIASTTASDAMYWALVMIKDPANQVALTWTDIQNSAVQYALAPDTATYALETTPALHANVIASGYFSGSVNMALTDIIDSNLHRLYYRESNGDNYELHLLITTCDSRNAENVYGSLDFKELI